MSTAKNIIASVFAGSVVGIFSSFLIKKSSKNNPEKKYNDTSNGVSNLKEGNEDNHFFV